MQNVNYLKSLAICILISQLICCSVNAQRAVNVDDEVFKKFEKDTSSIVFIIFKDSSNITIDKQLNRAIKHSLSQQRDLINRRNQELIVPSIQKKGLRILGTSSNGRWIKANITRGELFELQDDPNILSIELPIVGSVALDQSIPLTRADEVWDLGYTGKGITVCVIDTGVNKSHESLIGKVIDEYCYCSVTDYGNGGCCLDNTTEDDSALDDGYPIGHGTPIAGIITSNDSTYRGIAPDAKIVSIKVTNKSHTWTGEDLVKGIYWCRNHSSELNISVITISLGTGVIYTQPCDDKLTSIEINNAHDEGIFVSVASGNDLSPIGVTNPACASGAVSVAGSTDTDSWYYYSNRGPILDLVAPGSNIHSPHIAGGFIDNSGTSFAAPHVAGAAALLQEYNSSLSPDDIRDALKDSGVIITDDGFSNLSYSRIDVEAAIKLLSSSEQFEVSNTGGSTLNITNITWGTSWISEVSPRVFTLGINNSKVVSVQVDTDELDIGIYYGGVSIISNDPDQGNYTIPITLKILSPGCTGECPPPQSGDWVINQDTYLFQTPVNLDGKISVQGGNTFYLVDTHLNATSKAEIGSNSTFSLYGATLRIRNGSLQLGKNLFMYDSKVRFEWL